MTIWSAEIKELQKLHESFKGQHPDLEKEFGVNYIVEGSGQKSGNKVRLRVQLIKAEKEEGHYNQS